jgi:hypothetical protein
MGTWPAADDLDAAAAGHYRLRCRFVALGDQLVRQLRAADDRPAATCVAALRRPTVSVWVAIQLAGAAPNALAELLEAGAALVRAQQDALAGKPEAARALRLNAW